MELRGQVEKKAKMTAQAAASSAAAQSDKTGLAHPDAIDDFVAQMKAVEAGWDAKKPEEKTAHFQSVIDARCAAAGMPAPTIELMPAGGGRNGEFNAKSWSLGMTAKTLEKPLAETAGTAYHETRHAQQFFLIAKHIAKTNIQPPPHDQIPSRILTAAKAAQLASPMSTAEEAEAKLYHTSVYGAGHAQRNRTLTALATHTPDRLLQTGADFTKANARHQEALAILESYKDGQGEAFQNDKEMRKQDPVYMEHFAAKKAAAAEYNRALAATQAEKTAFDAAQAAYRALPEEADAFAVGDAVTAKLKETASA